MGSSSDHFQDVVGVPPTSIQLEPFLPSLEAARLENNLIFKNAPFISIKSDLVLTITLVQS